MKGLPSVKLSPGARDRLVRRWSSGNVRELENTLERALIVAGEGEIGPDHLALGDVAGRRVQSAADLLGKGFSFDDLERDVIHATLERRSSRMCVRPGRSTSRSCRHQASGHTFCSHLAVQGAPAKAIQGCRGGTRTPT